MAINLLAPGGASPSGYLIYDTVKAYPAQNGLPAAGPGGTASFTKVDVDGVETVVSAALEIQSTLGGLLIPRMTTDEREALVVTDGFLVFDTDDVVFYMRASDEWQVIANQPAGGYVEGPETTTVNSVATWGNGIGTYLKEAVVEIAPVTGNMTGVGIINATDIGDAITPTYSFTGRTDIGMYTSADDTLDFATHGARQFQIYSTEDSVNFLQVRGAVAENNPSIVCVSENSPPDTNFGLDIFTSGDGAVTIKDVLAENGGQIRLAQDDGTEFVGFKAPTNGVTTTIWQLPATDGTNGQALITNGSGVLSWGSSGTVTITGTQTANHVTTINASNVLQQTPVLIAQGTGNVTGVGIVNAGNGAEDAPTYSFTSRTDTGMWTDGAAINFSTAAATAFQIAQTISATDYIIVKASIDGLPSFTTSGDSTNIDLDILLKGTGLVRISSTGAHPGRLILTDNAGTGWVGFSAPSDLSLAELIWQLPLADGTAGQALTTNGSQVLSFSSVVQVATGTLSSAQWQGMYATPVDLIPAPGAGKMVVVVSCSIELVWVSAEYTGGGTVALQYGSAAHDVGPLATATIAASAFTVARVGNGANSVAGAAGAIPQAAATSLANTGIYISNGSAAFATGDSTFKYSIAYYIASVS